MSDDKNEARSNEFEGKDLEEAISIASKKLKIPEDDLHYEIVEQGRRGLFGLGTRDVRIRVKPPVSQLTDREIRDGTEVERRVGVQAPVDPERRDGEERRVRKGDRSRRRRRGKRSSGSVAAGDGRPGPDAEAKPRPDGSAQVEGETGRPRPRPRRRGRRGDRKGGRSERRPDRPPGPDVTPEQAREVQETLQQILDLMGVELQAEVIPDGDCAAVQMEGPDSKLLRGRNSELQGALHLLMNRMARRAWPGITRIHVSAEGGQGGQSRGRDEEVVELTREVAQQVARTGKTKKLHPMNAYERRLVHLTVREFQGLSSSSDGRGAMKCVRISKIANELLGS